MKTKANRHRKAPQNSDLIGVDEVGAMLGLGRNTVYSSARRGEIPHRKVGAKYLFSRVAIERWLRGSDDVVRPSQPDGEGAE